MNVICYKRVSTDDQADRGFSLQHQEKMLTQYCEINKYNIVDIYTEDYSGKTFDRPKWNEIMEYIKKNKGTVDIILCLRWDRFSRNQYDALTTIKTLKKLGVTVQTVEQQLDLNNPDNKILLSMYLTLPEVENDKNSIRTTEGSHHGKYLVASFQKNSFLKKEELQLPPSRNLYRFYSRLPMFYKGLKIRKRSKMTSCLLWLPRLDSNYFYTTLIINLLQRQSFYRSRKILLSAYICFTKLIILFKASPALRAISLLVHALPDI